MSDLGIYSIQKISSALEKIKANYTGAPSDFADIEIWLDSAWYLFVKAEYEKMEQLGLWEQTDAKA